MQTRDWSFSGRVWYGEVLDKPYGWSLLWYCGRCGTVYASAVINDQPYKAVGGCCEQCQGSRWSISGSLECADLIGRELPEKVLRYKLERELAFLDSPQHPYNEKENDE